MSKRRTPEARAIARCLNDDSPTISDFANTNSLNYPIRTAINIRLLPERSIATNFSAWS